MSAKSKQIQAQSHDEWLKANKVLIGTPVEVQLSEEERLLSHLPMALRDKLAPIAGKIASDEAKTPVPASTLAAPRE